MLVIFCGDFLGEEREEKREERLGHLYSLLSVLTSQKLKRGEK